MMIQVLIHTIDDITKQYLNVAIPPYFVDDHANNPCNIIDDDDDNSINLACNSLPPGSVNASLTGSKLLFVNVILKFNKNNLYQYQYQY